MAKYCRNKRITHAPAGAKNIHLEGSTVRIGPARYNVPVNSPEEAAMWVVVYGQLANVPADQAEAARQMAQKLIDARMGLEVTP